MMHFQSKTHISPLLSIESPVAQQLEHLARSCKVMGGNLIWNLDFFFGFDVISTFYACGPYNTYFGACNNMNNMAYYCVIS